MDTVEEKNQTDVLKLEFPSYKELVEKIKVEKLRLEKEEKSRHKKLTKLAEKALHNDYENILKLVANILVNQKNAPEVFSINIPTQRSEVEPYIDIYLEQANVVFDGIFQLKRCTSNFNDGRLMIYDIKM